MKKCQNCGKTVFGNKALICPKCGEPFPSTTPFNGTIKGGLEAMEMNDFPSATHHWIASVRANGEPDDWNYKAMLAATSDCIIRAIPDMKYYSREGLAGLATDLKGRLLMEDLMNRLAAALPKCASKSQLNRLAAEYFYIALESFNVYPSMRYMTHLMEKTHEDMSRFNDTLPSLKGETKTEAGDLRFYVNYTEYLAGRMNDKLAEVGPEAEKTVIEFWKDQTCLTYGQQAIAAAKAGAKYYAPERQIDSRKKSMDSKIDEFFKSYFEMPFKTTKK